MTKKYFYEGRGQIFGVTTLKMKMTLSWFFRFMLPFKQIVKTQRNSTQLKATLKQLALELDTVVTCSTHPTHPTTNFSTTSRPARELKFGTDTH